jgi:uncharacterized membrane protein
MSTLQRLTIALVLLPTGILAGLQTLMLMGVLPAIARMPLVTYAGAWQAMDHYMAVRMPVLVNITLVLYLVAILSFVRERRRYIFWTLLGCFALILADTILTVTQQLPINRAVQAIDLSHFDAERVQQLRDTTIHHFHLRGLLSITAFVWLVGAVAFSLDGQRADSPEGMEV